MVNATPWSLYPRDRDPVPIVYEAGWALGPVWTGAENLSPPLGFDPRTVKLVASRYTDCAIPAHPCVITRLIFVRLPRITQNCRSLVHTCTTSKFCMPNSQEQHETIGIQSKNYIKPAIWINNTSKILRCIVILVFFISAYLRHFFS